MSQIDGDSNGEVGIFFFNRLGRKLSTFVSSSSDGCPVLVGEMAFEYAKNKKRDLNDKGYLEKDPLVYTVAFTVVRKVTKF